MIFRIISENKSKLAGKKVYRLTLRVEDEILRTNFSRQNLLNDSNCFLFLVKAKNLSRNLKNTLSKKMLRAVRGLHVILFRFLKIKTAIIGFL